MENIREIVARLGIECDAAQLEKEVLANYRTIAEVDGTKAKIDALNADIEARDAQIADLGKKVDELSASGAEIDALKAQVEQYRASEQEAKQKAEADAAKQQFEQSFNVALKDRKFSNDFTRRAVMDEVRKMRETDSVSGIEALIEQATKDVPDVWLNPNKPNPQTVPGAVTGKADAFGADGNYSLKNALLERMKG